MTFNKFLNRALCVLGLLAALEIAWFSYQRTYTWPQDLKDMASEGGRAMEAGANAEANPYKDTSSRKAWLDGWIEAKLKDKARRDIGNKSEGE